VVTAGNFIGAAQALGVSASHVSRAVARLESRIQGAVFFRTTRSVTLTDTGRVLLEHCQRIIQERDEAFALVSGQGEPQGDLRLTCSTSLGERFVAPIVRRFAEDYPRLNVAIELTNRVIDLVAEGYDLAIRTGHLSDSRLVGARIATRQHFLCASSAYLEQSGRPACIDDLARHNCLIGTSATWHFQVEGRDQAFRPKGRWRCNNGFVVAEAALAGLGLCQLPEFYVLPHIKAGRLEALLPEIQVTDEPIWAVYPQRRHLLPKVRNLVDRLRAELGPALHAQAA